MEPKDNSSPGSVVEIFNYLAQNQKLPSWIAAAQAADVIWTDLVLSYGFPKEISEKAKMSLRGYTFKAREFGLLEVMGQNRMVQFQAFVDDIAKEYGDALQPTEKGNAKIGVRRLMWDTVSFAEGCMPTYEDHVNAAAHNGEIYERTKKDTVDMWLVTSPVDNKQQLPASFPSKYPAKLAQFMEEKWKIKKLPQGN